MKNNSQFGKCAYIYYRGGVQGEPAHDIHLSGDPAKIVLGAGQVAPGIEDVLSTMSVGEEKTVVVPPEQAYGSIDPDGVQVYPRNMFSFGKELKEGDVFQWNNPASGMPIPVRVIESYEDAVKVDFNHPQAGKTIEYWLKVVKIDD